MRRAIREQIHRVGGAGAGRAGGWSILVLVACLLLGADAPQQPASEQPAAAQPAEKVQPAVYLVPVTLPLSGTTDLQLIGRLDRFLAALPDGGPRPIVVFEFRSAQGATAPSSFERALTLARYLSGERFSRVRTVAYVPQSLEGHALLPMLACEEIIAAPDAELGAAGRDEVTVDETVRSAYRELAGRRRTVPEAVVIGMLDPAPAVVEVQLAGGGVRYVLPDELAELRSQSKVWKERTVIPAGEFGRFTGRQLRLDYGFVSHLAANRTELAEALDVSPESLRDLDTNAGSWVALQVEVRGRITSRAASETIQAMRQAASDGVNLLVVAIDSPGGEAEPTLRLVNHLVGLDPATMRTVAHVRNRALSAAALLVVACDEAYVGEDARLGGPGDPFLDRSQCDALAPLLQGAARTKGRGWSLWQALIDPELEVFQFRREGTGVVRYFCEQELQEQPDGPQWRRENAVQMAAGVSAAEAGRLQLVRGTADSLEAVLARYQIDKPVATAQRNAVVQSLERLALQPWFARTLLFVAFFALITEASAPGIGVAGFVSGLCFLLFFWSQFLSGTAGWLELLLFGGGFVFLMLELLVIPGFGIFGVGGIAMILASILLASQTFIIPHNAYQMDQLPNSLFTLVVGGAGGAVGMWMLRKLLPEAPGFRRMMLPPPDAEELDQLEQLVDWSHLKGKRGMTTTPLTPSGKAQFGDEIVAVISAGLLVPPGTDVYVKEVRGNHVLVAPLDNG